MLVLVGGIVAETREGEGSDGVGCVLLPFLLSVFALQFSLWTSSWYVSFLFSLFRGFFLIVIYAFVVCLFVSGMQAVEFFGNES